MSRSTAKRDAFGVTLATGVAGEAVAVGAAGKADAAGKSAVAGVGGSCEGFVLIGVFSVQYRWQLSPMRQTAR